MPAEESPIIRVQDGERVNEVGQTVPAFRFISLRMDAVENPSASAAAGRKVFDRVLYVTSHFPGSRDTHTAEAKRWRGGQEPAEVSEPALVEKFGEILEKFEAKASIDAGLPIAVLNLDVVTEAELRTLGVTTVEALSSIPDARLKGLTNGLDMRSKARKFLEAQEDAAPRLAAEAAAAEAKREADELREEMAALRAEMAALRAGNPPAPARRGRPPKEV